MFEFSPIVGAFSITVKLVCCPTDKSFHLTNIYGPSNVVDRTYFIFCCYNFDKSQIDSRGDINLIRSRDNRNRNRPRGNVNDLAEISLEGRASLWSSIQSDSLLEKLDWVFTSSLWVIFYPSYLWSCAFYGQNWNSHTEVNCVSFWELLGQLPRVYGGGGTAALESYSLLCQCCSKFKWEIQAGEIWAEEKEQKSCKSEQIHK